MLGMLHWTHETGKWCILGESTEQRGGEEGPEAGTTRERERSLHGSEQRPQVGEQRLGERPQRGAWDAQAGRYDWAVDTSCKMSAIAMHSLEYIRIRICTHIHILSCHKILASLLAIAVLKYRRKLSSKSPRSPRSQRSQQQDQACNLSSLILHYTFFKVFLLTLVLPV